jgi:hypothetical protein
MDSFAVSILFRAPFGHRSAPLAICRFWPFNRGMASPCASILQRFMCRPGLGFSVLIPLLIESSRSRHSHGICRKIWSHWERAAEKASGRGSSPSLATITLLFADR